LATLVYNGPAMVESGEPLSAREQEIVCLLATGATNRMIAHQLGISPNTVKVHLRNVFSKLGISSRTEATVFAIREGWVEVGDQAAGQVDLPTVVLPEEQPRRDVALDRIVLPPLPWYKRLYLAVSVLTAALLALLTWPRSAATLADGCDNEFTAGCVQEGNNLAVSEPESLWVSASPLSIARGRFGVAHLGGRIYVIGGETAAGLTASVMAYDPMLDLWALCSDKPTPAANVQAVAVQQQILVPGGSDDNGDPLTSVELYDPGADRWSNRAPLPAPLTAYAAATWSDQVFLFGGWDGRSYSGASWVYDLGVDRWQPVAPMPTPRGFAAAVTTESGILVVGGYDGRREYAACERYLPDTNVWESCSSMSTPRGGPSGAEVAGQVYLIGGGWSSFVTFSERYNSATDTWHNVETPLLMAGGEWRNLGAVRVGTRIYALGGWQHGRYLDVNLAFETLPNRLYMPAAISR
jgi:DNA-binding CsgD family transcriptional regulator